MNRENQRNEVGEVIDNVPDVWGFVCRCLPQHSLRVLSRGGIQSDVAFTSALWGEAKAKSQTGGCCHGSDRSEATLENHYPRDRKRFASP